MHLSLSLQPLESVVLDLTEAQTGTPAVSVLMPVRNAARHLDAALQSLAHQTFVNFEIVVIDNGSTDATWEILTAWAAREPRLRSFRFPGLQLATSLNQAASLARGPLLARLDGDDVAYPDRLSLQVSAMEAEPLVGVLGSAVELIDDGGTRRGVLRPPLDDEGIRLRHRTGSSIVASSTIMRADLFHRAGGYREGLNISEDYDLFTRISEVGEIRTLPETLAGYRIHDTSITARQPLRMALASLCVTAAAIARQQGVAEPFANGRPSLRQALLILGMSRRAARRQLQWRSAGTLLIRKLVCLPVPTVVSTWAPRFLHATGIRKLHAQWLRRSISGHLPPTVAAITPTAVKARPAEAQTSV